MDSVRRPCSITVCLLVLATACICYGSPSPSLWGKNVVFSGRKCVWQLGTGCVVPPLEKLSVCVDLRQQLELPEWTGFVYKARGERQAELGLAGKGKLLVIWLFGQEWSQEVNLPLNHWHNLCLTWSGHSQRLRLYVNGSSRLEGNVNTTLPRRLAHNGTLTLGVNHNYGNGALVPIDESNFLGTMTLFRMWGWEKTAEEMRVLSCADGDVVSWDARNWDYKDCPPHTDRSFKCAWSKYKIKLSISVRSHAMPVIPLEDIIHTWLGSIFSGNVSVHDIYVLSPRQTCHVGNKTAVRGTEEAQGTRTSLNLTANTCVLGCGCVASVSVSPETDVGLAQAEISTRLCHIYRTDLYTLTADPRSVSVRPIEAFHKVTDVPPTVTDTTAPIDTTTTDQRTATVYSPSTETPSFDIPVGPTSISTTRDALDFNYTAAEPGSCPEETLQSIYGVYVWPALHPTQTYYMTCEKNPSKRASRLCMLDDETEKAKWALPKMKACKQIVTISDLDQITVTANNSVEVVEMIEELVTAEGPLSDSQLGTVVQKLEEVTGVSTVTPDLGKDIVNIIADLLGSSSNLSPVANKILNLTVSIGDRMDFSEDSLNVTVPSLALSIINVDPEGFDGLTFGVSSLSTSLVPEIFVNQAFVSQPFPGAVASISLPSALQSSFPQGNRTNPRVQFHFYGTKGLFEGLESYWTLNTYVVSASVNNSIVSNLTEPVVVTLSHRKAKEPNDKVQCVYWNFRKNNGTGGWDDQGCVTLNISAHQTTCHCNHLTHFAVLLDVSGTPISEADGQILTVISYLGCGVSSIFLGISLLTYVAFEKLRRDYPSKILINLSVALLGLNLIFLLNSWLSSFGSYGLCIATAATTHYFLLASFAWMGLGAVHMYFALVKVFNVYVPYYILKFCAIGWGIPLVIVSLVLAIEKDAYGSSLPEDSIGSIHGSESFCWVQSSVFFYVTVVAYVILILLCNITIFIVVLVQIRHMQTNKPAGNNRGTLDNVRAVASLTFLLGLTWPIAFFTWGPARLPMLYLFSILNSLQGFFIFLFHCLMKENVRKQWRIHLCCGRFRLSEYSDWSRSVTMGGRSKQNQLVQSPSVKSANTSSSRKVSDSSTDTGPVHQQGA